MRPPVAKQVELHPYHVVPPVALTCHFFATGWLCCRERACPPTHIVARWMINFRDLVLTLDEIIAKCPRQPYS